MTHKWDILIATLGERDASFEHLMITLMPQVHAQLGAVRVTALWNHGERSIGTVRQDLLDSATGDYVSFIDDDDDIPCDFVSAVCWQLRDDVDYVGWRMQCYEDGVALKPTFHSLRFDKWHEDAIGFYRDVSHLNPIRRTIAQQVPYDDVAAFEDHRWAQRVRPLVHTENFIDSPMYHYHSSSRPTTWGRFAVPITRIGHRRVEVNYPWFRYHPNSSSEA